MKNDIDVTSPSNSPTTKSKSFHLKPAISHKYLTVYLLSMISFLFLVMYPNEKKVSVVFVHQGN